MTPASIALYSILFGLGDIVAPSMLVWGWVRWINYSPRIWKVSSTLSFIGFLFATASALFALWTILFASGGGFGTSEPHYAPKYALLFRYIRWGALTSALGIVFAIAGVWRSNLLRWHALTGAVGSLAFWLLATTWP